MLVRWLNEGEVSAGTPAPVAAPATGPALGAVDQAIATARANLAAGNPLITPDTPPAERNPDGTFKAPPTADAPTTAPDGTPEVSAPPVEGDADGVAEDDFTVPIPPRREGDEEVVLRLGSKEEVERVNQLKNAAMRGDDLRRAQIGLEQEREQLTEIQTRLQLDPEGFLFDNIPEERRAMVAFQILLEPPIFAAVSDMLREALDNEGARERARLTLENERLKTRDDIGAQLVQQREAAQNATEIKQTLAMLVPDTLPKGEQLALFRALQGDVVAHANRFSLNKMAPDDVLLVVANRLRAANIDPMQIALGMPAKKTNPAAETPVVNGARQRPALVQPTGPALVNAQKAVARAAAAPSGGGIPPTAAANPAPPAGQSIEDRLKWARAGGLKFH